jgi:hypothetical protein
MKTPPLPSLLIKAHQRLKSTIIFCNKNPIPEFIFQQIPQLPRLLSINHLRPALEENNLDKAHIVRLYQQKTSNLLSPFFGCVIYITFLIGLEVEI